MVVCGATKHGKLRTCHVPRTACDQHGIAQVSPSKDVKQMEEDLERLRSENFNLRIRIGDFESDSAEGFHQMGSDNVQGSRGGGRPGGGGDGDRVGVLAARAVGEVGRSQDGVRSKQEHAPPHAHAPHSPVVSREDPGSTARSGGGASSSGDTWWSSFSAMSPQEQRPTRRATSQGEDALEFSRSLSLFPPSPSSPPRNLLSLTITPPHDLFLHSSCTSSS
jgi:hypothetical protein